MMKRFSRKRRSSAASQKDGAATSEWIPKIIEAGILDAKSLDKAQPADVPEGVAGIGKGE